MAEDDGDRGDRLDALAAVVPFSPLTALGALLGVLILLRSWADPAGPRRDLVVSALPIATCAGVVIADRWLIADDVGPRDRLTVFAYALGGFLTAWIITGVQVPLLVEEAGSAGSQLFLMLVGGTVGVAAGTVAGTAEVRQRQAARAARRERHRLEEFASVVSHDLRNPLEIARGYLTKAFETGDPDHLIRVNEALDRMNELIEDSLALAREGAVVENPEPVELEAVVRAAWDLVDTGDAVLRPPDGGVVEADEARLRELLENLFRNAVAHGRETSGDPGDAAPNREPAPTADGGTEPAEATLTVTVGEFDEGFYVADDGVGIPESERDAVFDRGHTTDENGSGLGLAIVETIAEAHGWRVAVTESDSGGARFEFRT
jgi:signal transduction histidine kinase